MTPMAAVITLVLGGYGNFGARICRALVSDEATRYHMALLVAGRDASQAKALADALGHGAQRVALDHQAPGLVTTLREWGVGLVIHTAGPFQAQAYNVAQAAEAGAHYIELADGRRFVCDFPAAMQAAFLPPGARPLLAPVRCQRCPRLLSTTCAWAGSALTASTSALRLRNGRPGARPRWPRC